MQVTAAAVVTAGIVTPLEEVVGAPVVAGSKAATTAGPEVERQLRGRGLELAFARDRPLIIH